MKKLNAGKFDTRIRIEKLTEPMVIISGDPIQTWEEHYQTWAMRTQQTASAKEEVEAMQRVSSDYTEFTIRYPLPQLIPNTKMHVFEVVSGYKYDIENIRIEGRNQYLILVCKQRQQL